MPSLDLSEAVLETSWAALGRLRCLLGCIGGLSGPVASHLRSGFRPWGPGPGPPVYVYIHCSIYALYMFYIVVYTCSLYVVRIAFNAFPMLLSIYVLFMFYI